MFQVRQIDIDTYEVYDSEGFVVYQGMKEDCERFIEPKDRIFVELLSEV